MEDYGADMKNEYDLYKHYENGTELPDGVWVETWLVEDDAGWKSHDLYEQHGLVSEDCYLIDWNEIGKPHMIKTGLWWKEKIETMEALYEMMKSVYPVANKIIDKVVEILDPDRESLNEEMQGKMYWPDYYTLGHYIWQAKDSTGIKEEDTDDE